MGETRIGVTSDIHEREYYLDAIGRHVKDSSVDALCFSGDHVGPSRTFRDKNTLDKKIESILSKVQEDVDIESYQRLANTYEASSLDELYTKKDELAENEKELLDTLVEGQRNIGEQVQDATITTHENLRGFYDVIGGETKMFGAVGNHDLTYTNDALGISSSGNIENLAVEAVFNTYEKPQHYSYVPPDVLPQYSLGYDVSDEDIASQFDEPEVVKKIQEGIENQSEQAQSSDILLMHKLPGDKHPAPEYKDVDVSLRVGGHVHSDETEIWKVKNDTGRESYCVRAGLDEYVEVVMEDDTPAYFDIYTLT